MATQALSKEKVILSAMKIIDNQEKLTFTRLSQDLGSRSQSIYNYYPNVMELRIAIATYCYDKLATRLQADLLGLSGKQAVKAFANIATQYALGQFLVSQQVLSIPEYKLHNKELDRSFSKIHMILRKLLDPFVPDQKDQVILSRMLRNLIIGEIIHVGNERFKNGLITPQDSFDVMLDITLDKF